MSGAPLEKKPTFIPVVAVALRDAEGRLLLQQALPHKRHAGQWEFPGGKVENGETPRFALCREVAEELGIELAESELEPAGFAEEAGDPALVLMLHIVQVAGRSSPIRGSAVGLVHARRGFRVAHGGDGPRAARAPLPLVYCQPTGACLCGPPHARP